MFDTKSIFSLIDKVEIKFNKIKDDETISGQEHKEVIITLLKIAKELLKEIEFLQIQQEENDYINCEIEEESL